MSSTSLSVEHNFSPVKSSINIWTNLLLTVSLLAVAVCNSVIGFKHTKQQLVFAILSSLSLSRFGAVGSPRFTTTVNRDMLEIIFINNL